MQSMKEAASNVAASAKSGMEKTKATVQEKVDKMAAHSAAEKEMAKQRKEERINQAELKKQEIRQQNAAAKHTGSGVAGHPTGLYAGSTHTVNPHGQVL
ncbi:PREDICTED: 11 kDa late embryogenesis abundant protein [Nelumbo nucifera]|uniref:Uncharacterized protein n=2 Tax=Nelumbo nucifera TaxID=4432 RepID=A0A822ZFL4_NELNU|nr:PREDICTED: 11 kDa late embryogenesis abundant protein [Nelumbo nucifera]DAD42205.1 TPA_asm: hypothetical protein HUJ06_000435 [Nelumbo nucifera]